MAILGNNNKGASSSFGGAGTIRAAKATLAAASILTELHGWFTGGTGEKWILVIYADNGSGAPGARVAYTAPLTAVAGDIELFQTGFSVSLPAGNYWLGFTADTGSSQKYFWDSASPDFAKCSIKSSGGTFNPPNDPFGTVSTTDERNLSVWAVVTAAGPAPSGLFKRVRFGTGLTVTDEGSNVIRVDGSAAAGDATTSAKGIVQLAGDLAGTAASPQIAAGAIVNADVAAAAAIAYAKLALANSIVHGDVAAANKDGTAATPSLRTLGTGAQQAAAGNDPRLPPAAVAYGTTLPASPVDGQEAILVDNVTTPSYQWRFRYNAGSSSAYKWEFVGGSNRTGYEATLVALSGATLNTTVVLGPTLTLARAGEYQIEIRATYAGGSSGQGGVGVAIGGAGAGVMAWAPTTSIPVTVTCAQNTGLTVAAGQAVAVAVYATVGVNNQDRFVSLRPVRVA